MFLLGDELFVSFSPQANYTDWATATCRWNLVPASSDRGVSRGQRGGSPRVVNLSFLDRIGWRWPFNNAVRIETVQSDDSVFNEWGAAGGRMISKRNWNTNKLRDT
jgi:hypothetical protein